MRNESSTSFAGRIFEQLAALPLRFKLLLLSVARFLPLCLHPLLLSAYVLHGSLNHKTKFTQPHLLRPHMGLHPLPLSAYVLHGSFLTSQSEIHCKMAIFNPKSHAPETSEGSESASILLVRLFYICQATVPSFDILSIALAEGGFRGGLMLPVKSHPSQET